MTCLDDFNLWELVGGVCAVLLFAISFNIIVHIIAMKMMEVEE